MSLTSALQSLQHALDVRRKVFGEELTKVAESYSSLGNTQHGLGNYTSALLSDQHALYVRIKLFGEEHGSCHSLAVTQFQLGDYSSALQLSQYALDVRRKLHEEQRQLVVTIHSELHNIS